jgi:tetratricopeptide (TPR) repeat protein
MLIGIDDACTDNTEEQVNLFFEDHKDIEKIVYKYKWKDSFSDARNEGMDKCTGDWIFILDGHEFIPNQWFNITENTSIDSQKGLELIKSKLTKDGCSGLNGEENGESDEVFLCLYQQPFIGQTPNNFFMQPRIYRNGRSKMDGEHNGKPIRYGRAAHNTIKFTRPELSVHFPEVMIIHDAPESNREERRLQRGEMNVKQLNDDLKINDKDTRALFYLGNTHLELKEYDKAVDCYKKYLKYQKAEHSELYQCLLNMALAYKGNDQTRDAQDTLGLALASDPSRRDAVVLLGDIAQDKEDYEKAITFYDQALTIQAKPSRMFNNGGVYTWLPHQSLAMCYKALGNKAMAISHLKICLNYANHEGWHKELKELGESKNVLILDSMGSFTGDFEKYMKGRGYDVIAVKEFTPYLGMWADYIWCEWADRNATGIKDFANKTVIRVHGYEAYQNQAIFGQINWECKKVVFVAEHIKKMMMGLVPSLNGQCTVISNGVDTDKFYIKERKRDRNNVGYAGFLNGKKNPMRLAKIIKDHPEKVFHLRVDWQDNFLKNAFEYETKKCKNIVYHGRYEDLNDFWNKMTYVISTSDIESFSYNIAEGMSAGCEPLVYNWKGAKDIWNKKYIFNDDPKFKTNIDMEKNRDYIKSNYPLLKSMDAMERALVG